MCFPPGQAASVSLLHTSIRQIVAQSSQQESVDGCARRHTRRWRLRWWRRAGSAPARRPCSGTPLVLAVVRQSTNRNIRPAGPLAGCVRPYGVVVVLDGRVRAWCARLCGVHKSSLWAGLRGVPPPAEPFLYPTSVIVHYRLDFVYISSKIIYKLANQDWRRRMLTVVKIDGDKVKAAREERFFSQRELAGKAGINHNTVWRIEGAGPVEVHPRTIRKIAEALSVDPTSLTPQE